MGPAPNYSTSNYLSLNFPHLSVCTMTTPEPRAAHAGYHSAVTAVSNASIERITALNDTPENANRPSELPLISDTVKRALQRLANRAVPPEELPSVVETIVSSVKAANIAQCLEEGDAQPFIDAIDEARHRVDPLPRNCFTDFPFNLFPPLNQALGILNLTPRIRRKCVKLLYKTCADRASLPTSLRFELPEGPMGPVMGRGGFAEVFKCQQSCGREVAVKVLLPRTYNGSQRMVDVGHHTRIRCI